MDAASNPPLRDTILHGLTVEVTHLCIHASRVLFILILYIWISQHLT